MNLKNKILALLGSAVLIVGSLSVYYYVEKSVEKIESTDTEKETHKKTSKDKASEGIKKNSNSNHKSSSKTSSTKSNNESTNTTENESVVTEEVVIAEPEIISESQTEIQQEPITNPEPIPIPEENTVPETEYIPTPEPSYPSSEYVGTYTITAYTWTGSTMANGEYPYVGCVASCDFPLGTTICIEGVGTFVVNDVCPTSGVIDVYMNTYDECINFGCFQANVSIVY